MELHTEQPSFFRQPTVQYARATEGIVGVEEREQGVWGQTVVCVCGVNDPVRRSCKRKETEKKTGELK